MHKQAITADAAFDTCMPRSGCAKHKSTPRLGMNVALLHVYAPIRGCSAQPKSTLQLGMNVAL
eukprot:364747-Chlamydomonas_euryale.AAC.8